MLQNFVFQDNIYQVARLVDTLHDGMQLELSQDLFIKKLFDDILFAAQALDYLYQKAEKQSHLTDYLSIMQCLYSAENKFIPLISVFKNKYAVNTLNIPNAQNHLAAINEKHAQLKRSIREAITDNTAPSDTAQFVSQNELAALFNL